MRFDVVLPPVADNRVDPQTASFYALPKIEEARITRTFHFNRLNGQWAVNGQFMSDKRRFRIKQNTAERRVLMSLSGDWEHPVHIHFEEFQLLSRDRKAPSPVERSRKDIVRLQHNERVELFFRFRDFFGIYPIHCHNVVHEDHAMMLIWEITSDGDDVIAP